MLARPRKLTTREDEVPIGCRSGRRTANRRLARRDLGRSHGAAALHLCLRSFLLPHAVIDHLPALPLRPAASIDGLVLRAVEASLGRLLPVNAVRLHGVIDPLTGAVSASVAGWRSLGRGGEGGDHGDENGAGHAPLPSQRSA